MPRSPKPYSDRIVASYFYFFDAILDRPSISLTDAAVFSLLASLQRGKNRSSPTQDYIAARFKLSRRSVIRSISKLEKQGLITTHRLTADGGKTHNSYVVNAQIIEDLKSSRRSIRDLQAKVIRQNVKRQLARCDKLSQPPMPPKT